MNNKGNKEGTAAHLLLDHEMSEHRMWEFLKDVLLENNNIIKKPEGCDKRSPLVVWDEDRTTNVINVRSLEMIGDVVCVHGVHLTYHVYKEHLHDIIEMLLDWGVLKN